MNPSLARANIHRHFHPAFECTFCVDFMAMFLTFQDADYQRNCSKARLSDCFSVV